MITRGENFRQIPLNIVGSSTFGRYPKISIEKTYNLFQSDTALVPYAGYQIAIPSSRFASSLESLVEGRAIFTSVKLNCLIVVVGTNVYRVTITYNQVLQKVTVYNVSIIGTLNTSSGVVYIAENNRPQIAISDNVNLYIYDTTLSPVFNVVTLDFTPGYLTFHNTYFILAAISSPLPGITGNYTNVWRLSLQNQGYLNTLDATTAWPNIAQNVGTIQSKPDNIQAVVRFPSKGNMIFVMGSVVTESWFQVGSQLFPYQRNTQFNIDYGCLQPATIAYMDEIVVWLGINEQSGPVMLVSNGGMPKKISTDGIDYLFSTLSDPSDSQGFLYRQDGHLFYHINFYTDNLSLFYDFSNDKFYHATDEAFNYFIASQVAFFDNQYYFVTKNNGNMFAFSTDITTYDSVDSLGNVLTVQIPRSRTCANIRVIEQDYQIINDIGFTIESGETSYHQQSLGPLTLLTEDDYVILTEDGYEIIAEQDGNTGKGLLSLPVVDLSISQDGGASFGSRWRQYLMPIGKRKNKLMYWQLGIANDFVVQLEFWSYGRVVIFDGMVNVRI